MGMPYSIRQPAKNLQDIRLDNDMVGLSVDIPIFESFDDGLVHFKKKF